MPSLLPHYMCQLDRLTNAYVPHSTIRIASRLTAMTPRLTENQLIIPLPPTAYPAARKTSSTRYCLTICLVPIENTRITPSTVIEMMRSSMMLMPRQMLVCWPNLVIFSPVLLTLARRRNSIGTQSRDDRGKGK